MTEKNALKMNLDHERKIVELQSRVNKLENLCYMTKEVLNLEEASAFLGIAKSTLYAKMERYWLSRGDIIGGR